MVQIGSDFPTREANGKEPFADASRAAARWQRHLPLTPERAVKHPRGNTGDRSLDYSRTEGVLARARSAKGTASGAVHVAVSRAGAGVVAAPAATASMSAGVRARQLAIVKGNLEWLRVRCY